MRKLKLIALAALAMGLLVTSVKAQNEAPGSQVTVTATIPVGGFSCGRTSYPLYCYGVTANDGGSFWLDSYWQGTTAEGFIQFENVGNLGYATITGTAV